MYFHSFIRPKFPMFCFSNSLKLSRNMTEPTKCLCVQRRLRSAWASAQSDQSSLCAQWVAKDPRFLDADSEDSDQTGDLSIRWAHTHFVGFVKSRFKSCHILNSTKWQPKQAKIRKICNNGHTSGFFRHSFQELGTSTSEYQKVLWVW